MLREVDADTDGFLEGRQLVELLLQESPFDVGVEHDGGGLAEHVLVDFEPNRRFVVGRRHEHAAPGIDLDAQ